MLLLSCLGELNQTKPLCGRFFWVGEIVIADDDDGGV